MIFTNKFSNDWLIETMFDIHDYLIVLNIPGFSQQEMILIIVTNMLQSFSNVHENSCEAIESMKQQVA